MLAPTRSIIDLTLSLSIFLFSCDCCYLLYFILSKAGYWPEDRGDACRLRKGCGTNQGSNVVMKIPVGPSKGREGHLGSREWWRERKVKENGSSQ
ncbi:MAG: hypothetical protein J3R72DRAFT_449202 [Linnemannia gamsii]|nr:MAG: hypothetical protein J3R72DRAFT_449202 [Linnemannia gamsii]